MNLSIRSVKMQSFLDCCTYKSMLRKSRERSTAKKYLNRNLNAGHREPRPHYLERAGLRGRKKWLCCGLIFLLFLFALGHLAVTCFILGVLQFGPSGFQYFTFRGSATVWPLGASLSNITIAAPHDIRGYRDTLLTLSVPQDAEIKAEVVSQGETLSLLTLGRHDANVSIGQALRVCSKDGGGRQLLYGDASLVQVDTLSVLGEFKTSRLTTHMVSGINRVHASQQLTLRGLGGVNAGGGVVNITAGGGATLTGQRLVVNGNNGILLQGLESSSDKSDTTSA